MTKVPINFVPVSCHDCGAPYLVVENMEGRDHCPYCSHEKMYATLYEERTNSNHLCDEIEKLKRSNAALRGVITKLRSKVGKDIVWTLPPEVDLSNLENYNLIKVGTSSCDKCDYKEFGYNDNGRCDGYRVCTHCHAFKLKPTIKADLESGKAVAKGGK